MREGVGEGVSGWERVSEEECDRLSLVGEGVGERVGEVVEEC